jgi:hypothetical protein
MSNPNEVEKGKGKVYPITDHEGSEWEWVYSAKLCLMNFVFLHSVL